VDHSWEWDLAVGLMRRRPHYGVGLTPVRLSVLPSLFVCHIPTDSSIETETIQRSNLEERLPTSGVTGGEILTSTFRSKAKAKVTGSEIVGRNSSLRGRSKM